jgi:hypothetical protein
MYMGDDQNFFEPFFNHDDIIIVDETRRPLNDEHKQLTVFSFIIFKPHKLHEYLLKVKAARDTLTINKTVVLKGSTIFFDESSIKRYHQIAIQIIGAIENGIEKIIQVAYTQKNLAKLNTEVRTDITVVEKNEIKTIYGDELAILLNSLRDISFDSKLGKSVGVLVDNSGRFGTSAKKFNLKDGQFNTITGLQGKMDEQVIDITFVNDKNDYFNELILIPDSIGYLGLIKGNNTFLEENAKNEKFYPAFKFPFDLDATRKQFKENRLGKTQ